MPQLINITPSKVMRNCILLIALMTHLHPLANCQERNSSFTLNFSEVTKLNRSTPMPISQVWHRGMGNGLMYAYIPPYYEGKVVFAPPEKYRRRYFSSLSSDLQVVDSKELVLKDVEIFDESVWFNNTLQVFSSVSREDSDNVVLTVSSMDINSLNVNDDKKELIQISSNDKIQNVLFNYRISPDSSLLLIHYQVLGKEHGILSRGLAVFDNNFNQVWSDLSLQYNMGNGAYLFNDCRIDNTGNVYIQEDVYKSIEDLRQVYDLRYGYGLNISGKRRYVKQSPDYTSHLISISENGEKQIVHPLSFNTGKLRYLAFEPQTDKLLCVGLYSKPDQTSIVGIIFFEISPSSTKVLNVKECGFESEFILKGIADREVDKVSDLVRGGKEFENGLYNLQIKFKDDGGFWFLAEHYEVRMEQLPGPGTIWATCYYYQDIMVFNFNEKGEKLWEDKIDKLAYTIMDNKMYGSFSARVINDDLVVFYNQIGRRRSGLWNYRNATFHVTRFNQEGLESTSTLSSVKEHKVVFQPSNIGMFTNNQLFFFGQETRRSRFLKVTVN